MNTTEIIFAARDLGITLSTTPDDRIRFRPKSNMPDWLLKEIKANRDALLRDLLLQDALRFVAERYVAGADLTVLDTPGDHLNEMHASGTLKKLREAVRRYVQTGLNEFERAKRAAA